MIRAIADPAPKKQKIIDDMAKRAISELSPMAQLYGAQVSAKMEEVNGRVLDAPALIYGNKKAVRANQGAWDARRERFFAAAAIEKWVVIAFQVRFYLLLCQESSESKIPSYSNQNLVAHGPAPDR